jgi:hypothetical protein
VADPPHTMRALRVVLTAPALDEALGFVPRIEAFSVQPLLPQLPVKRLDLPVLPRTARLDEYGRHGQHARPRPPGPRDTFWAVVAPHRRRAASIQKQRTQALRYLPRREPPSARHRQTLTGVFIHHRQHREGSPILGARHSKVIRPDRVRILSPPTNTGAIGEPEPGPFGLCLRHRQPRLPPEPLHPLVSRAPPFLLEQGRDSPISIAALCTGQRDAPDSQSVRVLRLGGQILRRGSARSHPSARPAFGHRARVRRRAHRFSAQGRA